MGDVIQEISTAIKTLKYSESQIKLLDFDSGKELYYELLDWFVKSGDRRWWWEDFKQTSFDFHTYERPLEKLTEIIPDLNERVWLMVEDDEEEYYPIYDCEPSIIGQIIGECFGFEYYVIDKNLDWLICENHHNRLIGLGQKLKDKNIDKIK
ncbi:hypothetical protein INQ51_05825 [Maribellus sp. CM-23]|uniref:DUF6756 family protein n=1 Tax=Maribellus sp. CM-23 TaxID=2781026 RepID=UPI001F28D4A7|nr:DUF6756 family protein [Maribellus sp. CM-23]MCE4563822.1 hypothetical protein [Maribellus sp. CM-23]